MVEGSLEGSDEGMPEGSDEGSLEGTDEGVPEGWGDSEGLVEGSLEGSDEGIMEEDFFDFLGDFNSREAGAASAGFTRSVVDARMKRRAAREANIMMKTIDVIL
jgi:hypothetical protein